MGRLSILLLAAFLVAVVASPLPAFAQDILGLSVRPTDLLPPGTSRGTADIVRADDGGYLLTVDVSSAAESMSLDDFPGATAWVVWVVDMDGVRYNVGALDENLVLTDAPVDGLIARIFVTAESEANTATPSEQRVFVATLRDVEEVENGVVVADEGETDEDAAAEEDAAEDAAAEEEAAEEDAAEPEELPTTGTLAEDLLVLTVVAGALLAVGIRLRTVRV